MLSICDYFAMHILEARLNLAFEMGYGDKPVLMYSEGKGMNNADCQRFWNGIDCDNGYRREFFVQDFNFSNGACIYRPPNCSEAYYFRPIHRDDSEAGCDAFFEKKKIRIEILCSKEAGMFDYEVNETMASSRRYADMFLGPTSSPNATSGTNEISTVLLHVGPAGLEAQELCIYWIGFAIVYVLRLLS